MLSHADHDHYGGLVLLAGARAAAILVERLPGTGAQFAALRATLRAAAVPVEQPPAGGVTVDGVAVRVLHPGADDRGGDNDRSSPCSCATAPPACCCPATSRRPAKPRRRPLGRAGNTVLKVPHHGSATSSSTALLDAVALRLAVVSAGADNRFGFPAATVVAAYAARGAEVWRTDRDGAVTLAITADGTVTARGGRGRVAHLAARARSLDSQKSGSLKGGVAEPE
ncbi:MAG: hypothetical protein U0802_17595 [Candidatus Binatia bacterium]